MIEDYVPNKKVAQGVQAVDGLNAAAVVKEASTSFGYAFMRKTQLREILNERQSFERPPLKINTLHRALDKYVAQKGSVEAAAFKEHFILDIR